MGAAIMSQRYVTYIAHIAVAHTFSCMVEQNIDWCVTSTHVQGPGAVKLQLLNENKQRLKQVKKQAKDLALSINALKQQIDAANAAQPLQASPATGTVLQDATTPAADAAVSTASSAGASTPAGNAEPTHTAEMQPAATANDSSLDAANFQRAQSLQRVGSSAERVKHLKAQYREQYNELQAVKSEVSYTQKLVDQCTQELVMDFNEWYAMLRV